MSINESIERGLERLWAAMLEKLKGYIPSSGGTLTGDLEGKNITTELLKTTEASEKMTADKICVLEDGWIHWISPDNLGIENDNYATIDYVNSLMIVDTNTEV